jgi:hypothetical protein
MAIGDRFWNRVEKTDACWVWHGGTADGYGQLQIDKRYVKAHRYAWAEAFGQVPDGLCVLHRCDNRRCVRPDHLFLGTRSDNNGDRDLKGRAARGIRHGAHTHPDAFRGERHSRAKLTEVEVRAVRRLRLKGMTQVNLAQQFGVSRWLIRSICDGRAWGWLS